MNINWKQNNNEYLIQDIYDKLDKDLIFERLSYILNCSKEEIFKQVEEQEILYLIANILINRGITSKEDIDKCFNNIGNSINSPYILTNAEKAADKILEYLLNENAIIYIFADYDADGLTAGYVFTSALKEVAKSKIILKYPERKEGYGLNMEWCKSIVDSNSNPKLVVTVDNGIAKINEVEYLKENNIDVIITDHHSSDDKGVPNCLIVDPHNEHEKQNDNTKHLCGCGVAFKVAQIVQEKCNTFNMYNYTPYLAISTLTDVMPLTYENLAFIQYGLEIINGNNCPNNLKLLLKKLGIEVATSNDILWTIGPLLNACGRMGNTNLGGKLLFENSIQDEDSFLDLVNQAIKINENRRSLTKEAQKEISELNFDEDKIVMFISDKYPSGMISIIAGKLAETFNKPSMCCNHLSNDIIHGSVRSIKGLDILSIFKQLEDEGLIISSGGHKEACVCNFKTENFDKVKQALNDKIIIEDTKVEEVTKEMFIDEDISFSHLTKAVYALVNLLPTDNKKLQTPIFKLNDLEVVSYKVSKNNPKNLCLKIKEGRREKDIWAWGLADRYIKTLNCSKRVSLIGKISKNIMGYGYVLNVEDILAS